MRQAVRGEDGRIRAWVFEAEDIPLGREHRYVEGPEGIGMPGLFWVTSPMNPEPWGFLLGPQAQPLPAGFEERFGRRPTRSQFDELGLPDGGQRLWQAVKATYKTLLEWFGGVVEYDVAKKDLAVLKRFGLGRPFFHNDRYGDWATFPEVDARYAEALNGLYVGLVQRWPFMQEADDIEQDVQGVVQRAQMRIIRRGVFIPEAGLVGELPASVRAANQRNGKKAA